MSSFEAKMDVLPSSQRLLWPLLSGSRRLGMVLYGGTAVALRLGHRTSIDFDLFSERPLDRDAIGEAFPFLGQSTVLQDERTALTVLTPQQDGTSVKVQFFGDKGFGRVGMPQVTEDGVLEVASLDDLLATEVKVLLQRVERKDYQDIAAMIRAGVALEGALAAAQRMYTPTFQPSECLKALTYFEGGDLDELSKQDRLTLIKAAKAVHTLPTATLLSLELSAAAA